MCSPSLPEPGVPESPSRAVARADAAGWLATTPGTPLTPPRCRSSPAPADATVALVDRLGAAGDALAAVYPEAFTLADWQHRLPALRPWLDKLATVFEMPGLIAGHEHDPLRYWLEQHQIQPPRRRTATPKQRWEHLPALHGQLPERPSAQRAC